MKIITCAGFYGTGSSSITNLMSEYDNVKALDETEFRFVQDIDGISDLEFHLVENHNRHNSGHALKRFKKLIDFYSGQWFNKRFERFYHGNFKKISYKYIDELTDFTYNAHWFYDEYDKGLWYYYRKQSEEKILKKISKNGGILKKEITYASHPTEEKFLQCTRTYLNELVSYVNDENKEFVMVDQLVPPKNIDRFARYFDDIKVVVVDRDPRDIYYLEKNVWHEKVVPTATPESYCQWFKYVRRSGSDKEDPACVLRIHFEDLIYKYSETLKKIEDFCGVEAANHVRQFEGFNPKRSVVNTRLWLDGTMDEEIKVLEDQLSDYLYDYSQIDVSEVEGIAVENNKAF